LKVILEHKNCIGVDIASGIETDGEVDLAKIDRISALIASIKL
jgi:phosphoribosylanthranilate isomerase